MNLETKIFEVRDNATCIPVLATKMAAKTNRQDKLLRRVGFGSGTSLVQITHIANGVSNFDAYDWGNGRTMHCAHKEIEENFDDLEDGQVVDVRVYLGEQKEPARTDCI